ncbi:MAG: hypothetical protein Q7R56_02795 [Nanoarchaeota archaeon]|nr:hypothetical protein [Nanoarchaeota archaeon]
MSIYGLDILPEQQPDGTIHLWLAEINGIRSGMGGFKDIYGDNRVQEQVWKKLEQCYGPLQYYGSEAYKKHIAKKTILPEEQEKAKEAYKTLDDIFKKSKWVELFPEEEKQSPFVERPPFPPYDEKNPATVFNCINVNIPQPTVNSYVAEAIARNKLFTYHLLRHTALAQHLPLTALVGLGTADMAEIDLLLAYPSFIKKPLRGVQGEGIQLLTRTEMDNYKTQALEAKFGFWPTPEPLPDMVNRGFFYFENYIAIIQPFIDTRNFVTTQGHAGYGSIRAIVCNRQFVDAYLRVSENPVVNRARGAKAHALHLPQLAPFCEEVISTFEERSDDYQPENYQGRLYTEYFHQPPREVVQQHPHVLERLFEVAFTAMREGKKPEDFTFFLQKK